MSDDDLKLTMAGPQFNGASESINRQLMIPMKAKDIQVNGWYIHIDVSHQTGTKSWLGEMPQGGWFCEKTDDGWRMPWGHLEPKVYIDDDEWVLGPINLSILL